MKIYSATHRSIAVFILLAAFIPSSMPPHAQASPAAAAALTATIVIHPNQVVAPVTPLLLGSNTPAWLADNYANSRFRERTQYSGIGYVRIPGGSWSDMYGWLSCEQRVFRQDSAYQCGGVGEDWSSWITRPTDFINFLRATEKQAIFTINVNATAQEAAAAVAFFNAAPSDTTVIGVDRNGMDWQTAGAWAQLRADHGNPQPFHVQYWEFGNEIYGGAPTTGGADCVSYGWENTWTCDGTTYVNGDANHDGYRQVRAAMQAVDPSILVGAVGNEDPAAFNNWGNEVIQAAGNSMDFYVIHPYAYWDLPPNTSNGWAQALAWPRTNWSGMKTTLQNAFDTYAGGRQIPIAATEYNIVASQDQDFNQMLRRAGNALFIAESIGQAIQNGYLTANQWDLSNGCAATTGTCYDLLEADNNFKRAPQYYVFPLWAQFGSQMLAVDANVSSATLSVYAGYKDAQTYTVLVINKTNKLYTTKISFDNSLNVKSAKAYVVRASSLTSFNVLYNGSSNPPNNLSTPPPYNVAKVGATVTYTLAPYSVTLLQMVVP